MTVAIDLNGPAEEVRNNPRLTRARQDEYWAETGDIWKREISVFVLGRREKIMRSLLLP